MTTTEIWKDIPGMEGRYRASNFGRIISYVKSKKRPIILKPFISPDGYCHIKVYPKYNEMWSGLLHELIILTFKGAKPTGLEINHINGNKLDNTPENLEYVTRSENLLHAFRTGLTSRPNHQFKRKVDQFSMTGQYIKTYNSQTEAKQATGATNISYCCLGIRPHSGGYKWKYAS